MKPQVTAPRLAKTDPVVLPVVTAHQQGESAGAVQHQGRWGALVAPAALVLAGFALKEWLEIVGQGFEYIGVARISQLQLNLARFKQFEALLMKAKTWLDGGH